MASGHDNLVSEPVTMNSDAERVHHFTASNLLYPVTKDLLHQVFYAYGAKKICLHQMETRVEASVQFQSREDAEYARKTFHGHNIYHGRCQMDFQRELPSLVATNSSSAPAKRLSPIIMELKADIEELRVVPKELVTIIQEELVEEKEQSRTKHEVVVEEMHAEQEVVGGRVMSSITAPPT
uniref:PTBP1-like RNA recognition motif 2 domain-containing protein n=1 Tax=Oryza barthii TaxID=65489 RepID=A0A0D3FTG2_9ORYZ